MSDKKKTLSKETEKSAEKSVQKPPPKTSPKKAVNVFMVVILLMIAGGFYLHQKGYITKYYPLVKSKLAPNKSLEADVEIPAKGPDDVVEERTDNTVSNEPENKGGADENPSELRALFSSPEEAQSIALLQDRVVALEVKLTALSNASASSGGDAAQAHHVSLKAFSILQDLTYKIQQGLPFQGELEASKSLFSPEDFDVLSEFAKIGVPTLPYLLQHFKKVGRLLDQEEAFQSAKTVLEKGKALLTQLVHVEKVDGPAPTKNSKTATYKARLRQGDVAGVVIEIEALNHTDEAVALWVTHGKAYDTAQGILTKAKKAFFAS